MGFSHTYSLCNSLLETMFVFYFNLCILDFQLATVVVNFWVFFEFFDFFRFFWIFLPFSLTEFNGQQIKINEQNLTDRMASVSGHLYHCRHPRGPIKAPRGWGEWAPGGRLFPFALGAFWVPIPVKRGGRSRPPRLTGMGARRVPFLLRFGRFLAAHSRHPRGPIKAPRG